MQFNTLGSTGIKVSALAFGAGPIPALMTSDDQRSQQETLRRALDAGINWIDTAATYGDGRSEAGLGRALRNLGALDDFHIATKVRLAAEDLDDIEAKVRRSVAESCQRLGVSRITLLQLHNSITARRGDEPTSVTPEDVLGKGVLGKGSVLSAFRKLQDEGVVAHIGLTAIGHAESLREVIGSGQFATIQVPYNLLNRSAGDAISGAFHETDYGNVIADCARQAMGVFAIRVLAGGALASQPPSPYTFKTKFFPLDLYRRDQRRAGQLAELLGPGANLREHAVRLVLSHPDISSAIIGFGHASHVDEALACLQAGPLPAEVMKQLASFNSRAVASGVSG